MKTFSYRILKHIEHNMLELMKDKKKKVDLEERLRLSIANEANIDPNSITVDIVHNKMSDTFDLVVKASETE